jgi:hypothetical protein
MSEDVMITTAEYCTIPDTQNFISTREDPFELTIRKVAKLFGPGRSSWI